MNNLIKSWNGRTIRVRHDRYMSLTDMAQATEKRVNDWQRLKTTPVFIDKLSIVTGIPATDLIEVKQGGVPEEQGTWGHPQIAYNFAEWCSVDFAIQVSSWLHELFTTGKVELQPASPPKFTELPIAAVELSSQILKNAGVNVALVSSFQLDQYGKADSNHRHIYQDAKALLSAQYVIPELPMSPTELGKKIAERLGLAKPISAQKVNQALIEAGLQTSESITKNRGGKIKTEIVYHLTDAGEEFGEILVTTAPQNGKTVFPLRWFGPVVDQLIQLTSLQEVKS